MAVMSRRLLLGVVCLLVVVGSRPVTAQAPSPTSVTYITPIWNGLFSASAQELATQAGLLRSRIGEGPAVKVGFSVFLQVLLGDWHVDITNPTAIRAQLGTFEADLDQAIAQARSQNLALVVSLVTATRENVDAAQTTSFAEDRRIM